MPLLSIKTTHNDNHSTYTNNNHNDDDDEEQDNTKKYAAGFGPVQTIAPQDKQTHAAAGGARLAQSAPVAILEGGGYDSSAIVAGTPKQGPQAIAQMGDSAMDIRMRALEIQQQQLDLKWQLRFNSRNSNFRHLCSNNCTYNSNYILSSSSNYNCNSNCNSRRQFTGAAYARAGTYLFVLGGSSTTANRSATTDQFMALDLSVAWPASSPAWIQLQPGPKQTEFPAVFSKDFLTFYAFHIPAATSPPISAVHQYNVKTGQWAVTDGSSMSGDVGGIGAITSPLTGEIICAGGCTEVGKGKVQMWDLSKPSLVNTVDFPQPISPLPVSGPMGVFQSRTNYANVWCEVVKGVLYFGGAGGIKPDNTVTVLDGTSYFLRTMSTAGTPPPNSINHCMAAIDDGKLVIVYGGQNPGGGVVNGDLHQLNIATGMWSKAPISGLPRANAACAILGNQFLVWGGTDEKGQVASSTMLIYDYVVGNWITQYNPPASIGQPLYPLVPLPNSTITPKPPNSTGPSTSPPTSTTSPGPGAGDGDPNDGSKGGLIGGIVAAIVVVAIIIGYVLYRRRQKQREGKRQEEQNGSGAVHENSFAAATSPSTKEDFSRSGSVSRGGGDDKDEWYSLRGRPQANTNNNYTGEDEAAAGHQQFRAPQCIQAEYKPQPQAPQEIDDSEEFEQGLQVIENQQMQLNLKRQLLVLQQQQGQRVVERTSPHRPELQAIGSVSSIVRSGGWPRPPSAALGPQYVAQDEYVPPPPPKAAKQYPTVQSYPDRPSSSNYGYGYATSESAHRGHNPQAFN
ncbi:hypothetical protein BGZ47_008555 [Haplosporangium gracile]|nr:hypothetical protein BGZ47_008555 [Haplosporangium gracile]